MQPIYRVVVNRTDECRVAQPADIDRLCADLSEFPVFTVAVIGERGYDGPILELIVESGRATVFFLDISRRIKLASRDEACTQRGIVSLRNEAFPELELDQIEVPHLNLISPERAISILRHYLTTGEVTDLVPWPPNDWGEWVSDPGTNEMCQLKDSESWSLEDEIPF